MIKAVFLDFDGTVFSHTTHTIPESAKQALLELKKNGIKFYLATGRNLYEMKKLFPASLDIPFDGFVFSNGQLCLDGQYNVIDDTPFTGKALESLLKLFNEKKESVILEEESRVFVNVVTDKMAKAYENLSHVDYEVGDYSGKPIYLGVVHIRKEEEPELLKKLPGCAFQRWSEDGADIVVEGMSKAKGIEKLLHKLSIKPEECMAVGDSYNDIDMLKFVGTGVAMGNGVDDLKAIADFVTTDIDDNGLANALRHCKLIKSPEI